MTVSSGLQVGGNTIVAQYSGDTNYAAANSQASTVNVQLSSTTTTVTPSTTTPRVNTAFNVTAALTVGTPPAGTASPTGNMIAYHRRQHLRHGRGFHQRREPRRPALPGVKVTSPGSHNLQAIYAGDANYATSTSNAVAVNAAANTANVTLTVSPTQANATYNPDRRDHLYRQRLPPHPADRRPPAR